jgi:exodeoxyribonuclease III
VNQPDAVVFSVATWNVNSIRAHEHQVLNWLADHQPSVLALQETQCGAASFPLAGFSALGYEVAVHGDGGRSGVAIASRVGLSDVTHGVPGAAHPFDEPRIIAATVSLYGETTRVICGYAPNGKKVGTDDHRFKVAWFRLLGAVMEHSEEANVIVAADLNVAPTDRDVWDAHRYRSRNLTSPADRAAFVQLLDLGVVDVVRAHAGDAQLSTWWNRRGDFFDTDRGWRLDHVLTSARLASTVQSVVIDRSVRAQPGGSDHSPILVSW